MPREPLPEDRAFLRDILDACERIIWRVATIHIPALLLQIRPHVPPDPA